MGAPGDRAAWLRAYARGLASLGAWFEEMTNYANPKEVRQTDGKPLTRVNHDEGPMLYIGQQIVKRMEKMGYPSRIVEHYRDPERQDELYLAGYSKAKAWQSPHNYFEAVDIVHKTLYWNAPPEYWDALSVCVRVIETELNVDLEHGHKWKFVDSAHIEIKDWRNVRARQMLNPDGLHKPTPAELLFRWQEVLPQIKNKTL